MRQLLGDFDPRYYIDQEGRVYNSETERFLTLSKDKRYNLKRKNGKYKTISLKNLYKIAFEKDFIQDEIKDLQDEIWKPVEGTSEKYFVSNMGRVKSYKAYNAIILKPSINSGYERVDIIYSNGIRSSKLVSRLVAFAFLPFPSSFDYELHHINNIKTDNRAENLVWLSQEDHKAIHRKGEKKVNATKDTNGSESENTNN